MELEGNYEEKDASGLEENLKQQDLKEEIATEEEELLPPGEEKNEARQLNTGAIFAVIMFLVVIILAILLFLIKPKHEKKAASKQGLEQAGEKYFPTPNLQNAEDAEEIPEVEAMSLYDIPEESRSIAEKENIDEIIERLPRESNPQGEVGTAPINTYSSSSTQSSRPDTRNSNSRRKVDGIAGQTISKGSMADPANQAIFSAAMNGTYTPQPSRPALQMQPYSEQLLSSAQASSPSFYGSQAGGQLYNQAGGQLYSRQSGASQNYQASRETFFNNDSGKAQGEFLSYASIWEGTVISAALETAVNTDNPGLVIARVTENVYSSKDHSFLLIPQGTLLYATYNSSVSYGQNRVQIAWNLLIRPDGYKVQLGNMPGVDKRGASGIKGMATNHPFETLKALGLVAIFSVIQTEVTRNINSANNSYLENALTDVYSQGQQIGNKILDKALDIKPTIKIPAGKEIKLITNTTLELPPMEVNQVERRYVRTK